MNNYIKQFKVVWSPNPHIGKWLKVYGIQKDKFLDLRQTKKLEVKAPFVILIQAYDSNPYSLYIRENGSTISEYENYVCTMTRIGPNSIRCSEERKKHTNPPLAGQQIEIRISGGILRLTSITY